MSTVVSRKKNKRLPIVRRAKVEIGTLSQGQVSILSMTIDSCDCQGKEFGYGTMVSGRIRIGVGVKKEWHSWEWSMYPRPKITKHHRQKFCTLIPNCFVHNRTMNLAIKRYITGNIWSTKRDTTAID